MKDSVVKHRTAFTDKQYDDVYPEGIERHWWYVARNGMVSDLIREIECQGAAVGPMLEVGCGRGVVVDYLRRSGKDCCGVELAPVAVADHLRAHVWTGQDCLTLPPEYRTKVELVLLLDVIEHIEDAAGFIGRIRDAYPNCRWLIVSVPARMELWSDFDRHYGHFRRYDLQMLRDEFARAGVRTIQARYRFTMLYPPLYALVRWGKGRPKGNRTPRLAFLHRILGAFLRRETWIVPSFVYGTSILALGEFQGRDGSKPAS
jgi:hypothetical protein